jgi:signal transduction histidine kinase
VGTRQTSYTNLPRGRYRFRLAAANPGAVWSARDADFTFQVDPLYWQTWWFQLSLVGGGAIAILALHHLRVTWVARQLNIRFEERIGERLRIARDLHDTLLQSFQAVLMKFSTLQYLIRDRPEEAEQLLDRTIHQARQAITECREAVQGLRSSTVLSNDLARDVTAFAQGLVMDQTSPNGPEFRLGVEGKSRGLSPIVRDEVYHIACESLRNAFRHARARRIEVLIRYDQRQFHLRIVDDGKGIDQSVLDTRGRPGHHGLPGMTERARLAGGKLSVLSRLDSGTEIDLTIPSSIAYTTSPSEARL